MDAVGVGGEPAANGGFDAGDEEGEQDEVERDALLDRVVGDGLLLEAEVGGEGADGPEAEGREAETEGDEERLGVAVGEGAQRERRTEEGADGPGEIETDEGDVFGVDVLLAEDADGGHGDAETEAEEQEEEFEGGSGEIAEAKRGAGDEQRAEGQE